MKKELRALLFGFAVLNALIVLLMITFFIPNRAIYKNLKAGSEYYMKTGQRPAITGFLCTMNDASADSTELNIMMNNDYRDIVRAAFYTAAYRDLSTQDFIETAHRTIVDGAEANYDYNRYWHGYQILWRPMLVFFDVNTIRYICMAVYTALLVLFIIKAVREGFLGLAAGIGIMNIFHIIPFGFGALEYIPVFMIMITAALAVMFKNAKFQYILLVSGICTAFFDFWTAETLTFTVPCVVYACIANRRGDFRFRDIIFGILHWLIGYCGTFVYKWGISSAIYGRNFFKEAYGKYLTHTGGSIPADYGLRYNINVWFFNRGNLAVTYKAVIIFIFVFAIFLYLFRRKGLSGRYIAAMAMLALVPFIRYLVFNGHSRGYVFFTYRAQLVIIPIIVLLTCETYIFKQKARK